MTTTSQTPSVVRDVGLQPLDFLSEKLKTQNFQQYKPTGAHWVVRQESLLPFLHLLCASLSHIRSANEQRSAAVHDWSQEWTEGTSGSYYQCFTHEGEED